MTLSLGRRIRQVRLSRGLTLEKLGEKANTTKGYLSLIENGKSDPTSTILRSIAEALEVTTDWLLTRGADLHRKRRWRGKPPVAVSRRFELHRSADGTGVSGTGHVADGVQFVDGVCVLRWRTGKRSTVIYDNHADLMVMAVHGHGGTTVCEWVD